MGKYDKDRFLKELAIRYCLARGALPFLEVTVRSVSDLSDSVELLTDLDVLGVEARGDHNLYKTIFDCKTSKMSAINRAFWAAGVAGYTKSDSALVILKSKAVHNHRLSALSLNVDLHDEESFRSLGKTVDIAFPADTHYQSSIDRWNAVYGCYESAAWSEALLDLARNVVPLTSAPWTTFRRVLAEIRIAKGYIDPAKDSHVAIFFDILASTFVLWATLGRDIRRFYEPTISKEAFSKILRYYLWGGKDSYNLRQQLHEKSGSESNNSMDLPQWDSLVSFAGLLVSEPQSIFECAHLCRELSIRVAAGSDSTLDKSLSDRMAKNTRLRQYTSSLSDYLVDAGGLPKDFKKRVAKEIF